MESTNSPKCMKIKHSHTFAYIFHSSFGMFFLWSEKWSDYFAEKITISPIIKATIWGIVLALLTLITSYALYSGEFQIVPFVHQALQISPLFLLVIAVILGKPLLTAILLILLLPIELAPVILVSAYLAACLTKVSYSFRQKNN